MHSLNSAKTFVIDIDTLPQVSFPCLALSWIFLSFFLNIIPWESSHPSSPFFSGGNGWVRVLDPTQGCIPCVIINPGSGLGLCLHGSGFLFDSLCWPWDNEDIISGLRFGGESAEPWHWPRVSLISRANEKTMSSNMSTDDCLALAPSNYFFFIILVCYQATPKHTRKRFDTSWLFYSEFPPPVLKVVPEPQERLKKVLACVFFFFLIF